MNVKLDQLTSLRFFAAAMIVTLHSAGLFGFDVNIAHSFIFGQAVSFFFVLSGFVLAYVYPTFETYRDVLQFWRARFARIYPAHLATFLLAIWMLSLSWDNKTALANLALVHAWIPLRGFTFSYSYNSPSWSISTEFFFYIAFPILIYQWKKHWPIKLLLSGSIVVALVAYSNVTKLPDIGALLWINPVSRIFEFIVGIFILFYFCNSRDKIHWNSTTATCLELAAILLCVVSMHYTRVVMKWVSTAWPGAAFASWLQGSGSMFCFGLLIYLIAIGRGKISAALAHPFFVLLGEISYSIYLLHQILLRYYQTNITALPHMPNLLALSFFWVVLLLSSYLMWAWIEMPARRLILWKKKIHGSSAIEESRPITFGGIARRFRKC